MKIDLLKKIWIVIFPLFFFGCCPIPRQSDNTPYRVVTQVRIVYQNETFQTQRDFYREENIRHILEYLRYLDPYGNPKEDPEQTQERIYWITVLYSDGSQRIYEQRADRYFRADGGDWKRIEPHRAQYLSGLFGMMPSDQPTIEEPTPPLIQPQI